jgi:transposase
MKTDYSFHHMISTDGIGVSVLLLRKDLVGKKIPMMKTKLSRELYIDELDDYTELQNKKIVGIDPGKEDLIYCVDGASKEANHFRYSQNQRRKETKIKKYNNIILAMKTNRINSKTIIEYETELSSYNRKTLHIDKFKEYLEAIEEFGESGFQDGLSFPAIPFIPENGLGSFEIASLLNNLPSRS